MKPTPFVILGLLVLGGLIWILVRPPTSTPLSTQASPSLSPGQPPVAEEVVITIADEGFAPKAVTVKAGQTVTFINGGQENHWPASNIHPTHEIYPQFDPRRPVRPGERWSFVFERAGIWRFHDHLNPTLTGTVTAD